MVARSNDYGSCCHQYYTTFDGGRTWRTGNMSRRGPNVIGSDPITVFDPKHGTVIHLSLNFKSSAALPVTNGGVVASVSRDGGLTWEMPLVLGQRGGAHLFNYKRACIQRQGGRGRRYRSGLPVLWADLRHLERPSIYSPAVDIPRPATTTCGHQQYHYYGCYGQSKTLWCPPRRYGAADTNRTARYPSISGIHRARQPARR
jgi:hypothetical protein